MIGSRFGRLFTTAATLFLAAGSLVMAPAAQAARPGCLVVDTNLDSSYSTLQDAVDAANPGDLLFVKGTCLGSTTISKSLTITGHSNSSRTSATLDGDGEGPVLSISSNVVTINDLVITNGDAASGGGVYNDHGALTLNNSSVIHNTAGGDGGGIYNDHGTLTLNDSSVSANSAGSAGGGIVSWGGTATLNYSSVSGNAAGTSGGGIRQLYGPVTLNNSSVSGNAAGGAGGGVSNYGGVLTLNGSSSVNGNTAGGAGGGIAIWSPSTLTLNDSSTVRGNAAAVYGGGVVSWGGTLNNVIAGVGGNVFDNTPNNVSS